MCCKKERKENLLLNLHNENEIWATRKAKSLSFTFVPVLLE